MTGLPDDMLLCRWGEVVPQDDMTPCIRCLHPNAIKTSEEEGCVECLCLGLVDLCPDYEK